MVPNCFNVKCQIYMNGWEMAPIPLWKIAEDNPRSLKITITHTPHDTTGFHDDDQFSDYSEEYLWFEFSIDHHESTKGKGYIYYLSTHRSPRTKDQALLKFYSAFEKIANNFLTSFHLPASKFEEFFESLLNNACKSDMQKIADKIE